LIDRLLLNEQYFSYIQDEIKINNIDIYYAKLKEG